MESAYFALSRATTFHRLDSLETLFPALKLLSFQLET